MSDEKPIIFLSHSSKDEKLVRWLKTTIETYVDAQVFASDIDTSENWFETVLQHLDSAEALILLLTSNSIKSKWVWFEFGYFYKRSERASAQKCYPLYRNVEVPELLRDLHIQAASISDKERLLGVFIQLRDRFGNNGIGLDIDQITHSLDIALPQHPNWGTVVG